VFLKPRPVGGVLYFVVWKNKNEQSLFQEDIRNFQKILPIKRLA
jgi:hypothetical protein